MMNKLDINPTTLTYTVHPGVDATHALLVLVPTTIDYSAATRRIWELANATGMNVQLLGLCKDAAEESGLRRELITMASLLQDGKIAAEVKIDIGTNWLDVVKYNAKANDMLVCFAEQRTGLLRRPLSQILQSNLKATVYIISGLTPQKTKPNRLLQISAWLGSSAIILSFGALQANLVRLPEGWLQSTWLILSIIPEFLLLWFWNGLFG